MLLHKLFSDYLTERSNLVHENIKKQIKEYLVGAKSWDEKAAKEIRCSRKILTKSLEVYDNSFDDPNWHAIKSLLCELYLLPWARKHYTSALWKRRSLSARIFLLNPTSSDQKAMLHLLHDCDFHIRMIASEAIGKLGTIDVVAPLLEQMAKEHPAARFIYRHILNQMPYEFLSAILKTFENATQDETRVCCLDLLTHRFYGNVYPFLHRHLGSPNETIRSMIATILANIHSKQAVSDLIHLTKDSSAQVRKAALVSLGKVHEESAFEPIQQALEDDDYGVRLQAALCLANYGKKGLRALELQDSDLNPKAHEVARFVLTLP